MTILEWSEYWTENYDKKNCSQSTVKAHGYVLKNHILPALGDIQLNELTESDVESFLNSKRLGDQTMRNIMDTKTPLCG